MILGPNPLCCLAVVISSSWKVAVGFNDSSSESIGASSSSLKEISSELRVSLVGDLVNLGL